MNWTPEEREQLEEEEFKAFLCVAYWGPHEIVKELRHNHEAGREIPFYLTVTESLEKDVDGDLGPTWTHLGYGSLDDAIKKVKGTLIR